ncbi:MAG: ZIP family metal transporter [Gemmatimonadaceae bacterium]
MSDTGGTGTRREVPPRAALRPLSRKGSERVSGADRAEPGEGDGRRRLPRWLLGVVPLVLLALLVFAFLRVGPAGVLRRGFPPVEELTIERVSFPREGALRIDVVNGGPEAVTVAQLLIDDASWVHTIDGDRTIGRLESRTITAPYPWVEGEPLAITLMTSTGVTFTHDVAVATVSPRPDAQYISTFALLGLYAGVIPVFLGLLWFPFLRNVGQRWLDFFLSLTIGLLVFLGVDALGEALETAGRVSAAFQGTAVVLLGLVGAPLLLVGIGAWLRGRAGGDSVRAAEDGWRGNSPMYVATLVAVGIGLHNLGEGLAIGASYATGEIALGTFLVVGFLIHNSTEGLGILAPIATMRPRIRDLLLLGAIAGVPTVFGAWIGGFSYSPFWTTLFLAIGAGAIVQVVYELWRLFRRRASGGDGRRGLATPLNAAGVLAGMLIMYATGLLVPA